MAEYYKGEKLAEVGTGTPLTAAQQAAEIDASRKSAAASNTIPEPQVTSGLDRRNRNINDVAQAVAQDNQAITSDNLKQNGSVYIPPTQSQTAAAAVTGAAQSATEQYINNQALQAKKEFDAASSKNQSLQDEYLGIQRSRAGLEESAKIPELSKQANDAYTALQASQRAQANELRALDKAGMTDVGRQAAERGINRKYAFEQADLNISLDVANRAYSLAQANVDRKIELQLEPLKTLIGFQEGILNRADNKLTQATQNKVSLLLEQNKREYESEKDRLKTLEDTRLQAMIAVQKSLGTDEEKAAALSSIKSGKTIYDIISGAGSLLQEPGAELEYKIKEAQLSKLNAEVSAMGAPTITNPDATKYAGALSVILGSEKFTKEQKAAVVNSINSGDNPVSVVKNQAKNIMGQTLATDLSKSETALAQLKSLDSLIKQYTANGGKTDIFTGNYEKTLNKLGKTSDPKLAGISTKIALAMQAYRLAVTGTAASVQEDARIDNVFPGITNGQVLNDARTKATIDSFQNNIDSTYRNVLGKSYDDMKKGLPLAEQNPLLGSNIEFAKSIGRDSNWIISGIIKKPEDYPEAAAFIKSALDSNESPDDIVEYLISGGSTSFNQGGTDLNAVRQIKDGSRVSTSIGDGVATGIEKGSKVWAPGLDLALAGGKGAPVKAPFEGTIISAEKENGWGNSVKIKTADGRIVRLSHLNNINVKPGQKITAGTVVGGQGNTGTTYGKTGIHVDVTVYKPDGKPMTSQEVAALLGTKKV